MRFEEFTYEVDGRQVNVSLHAKLTVVAGLRRRARLDWSERALGVLLGTRPGDGVTVAFVDGSGSRIRLQRDGQGAATVTDVATGTELSYAAAHLPLDGRFDWFASIGLDTDSARALAVLDASGFRGDDHYDPHETDTELSEARDILTLVETEYEATLSRREHARDLRRGVDILDEEILELEEERARRRHGEATETVRRLEAELAVLNGAVPPERAAAQATLAAARGADQWHRAATVLEDARRDFADRPLLDPETLRLALTLPAEALPGLDGLHDEYLAVAKRRSELVARLDEGAASELPAPSAPWVIVFARHRHPELWDRAERVRSTRARADDLAVGLGGTGRRRDLIRELEAAHAAVEQAERQLEAAKVPALAMASRRRLAKALEREETVLAKAGFASWLAYQMLRIDVLLEPDALEALQAAERDAGLALDAWCEIAGDVDPEAALAVQTEIERYAVEMAAAERTVNDAEALRRELNEKVEPAYRDARAALLEACGPFDVEPEHATAQVAALVSQARHARLQQALDDADSSYRAAEARLPSLLADAGLPASSPADLDAGVAIVTARASEAAAALEAPVRTRARQDVQAELFSARFALAQSRPDPVTSPDITDTPVPETDALVEERCRLLEEAARTERGLPDIDRLADRREALLRRVAVLEASSLAGHHFPTLEEAEMVLLGRIAQARRLGPNAESVPLLADDPLACFPRHDKRSLLDLIARLSEATQVVYFTDDKETVEWASTRAQDGDVTLLRPETAAAHA